ncbi:hypothetical protein QF022_002305 [Vogesella perlucida]|nr:hypothetical protein [Vogesella perlucida]
MYNPKVSEACGQITPGNAGAVTVKYRIDEKAVVPCGDTNVANPSWQQVLDAFPLVISQRVSSIHGPSFVDAEPVFQDTEGN